MNCMVEEMDWECVAPLTMQESFVRDVPGSVALQDSSDEE